MGKYLLLVVGFALLIKGADYFVEASSSAARRLRVPSIIIGLTIVAFGTSAPELAVSTTAALSGNNEIAVGNVVGSNIFNLMVVLGMCAVIHPFSVKLRWDYAASVISAVAAFALICFDHNVSRIDGAIMLACFAVFLILTIRDALVSRTEGAEEYHLIPIPLCLLYIFGGLAAIVYGGNLVVDNASLIAESFGLSQTLIGLTIVAFGTSLPELVTSIIASRKGENGLALGNVIGSNIFNILMVLATSAAISPIKVSVMSVYDFGILIAFSLFTWLWCRSKNEISRLEGASMLALYVIYSVYIMIR